MPECIHFLVPSTRDIKNSSIADFFGETIQDCSIVILPYFEAPARSPEKWTKNFPCFCVFRCVSQSWWLNFSLAKTRYFTSSYPHHDIYTFCCWQIFWHSIWHIFWHFIWHIFWHSIWHIFWHSSWHSFWHSIWHISWHIFWHSIWHSIWHIFWHSIWPLRSSGAQWAGEVPGWGPAVRTELGRSQVEVQRCALSWGGPRLRSSGAHWAGNVRGWGPAVRTELGSSQVEVQRCALSWEVGEELGDELARRKWRWKLMQTWSRRNWRRRRGGGRGGGQLVKEEDEEEEEDAAGKRSDKI